MAADDGRPPLFRTWSGMYAFVVAALIIEIVLFSIVAWIYR